MVHPRLRKLTVAAAIAVAMMSSSASATDPSGVSGEILAAGDLDQADQENHDFVKFQTKDPTDLRVQRLTFQAGGTTGWHHHPGVVLVIVQSGSVTIWHTDCSKETYGPGQTNGNVFVEGDDRAHQAVSADGAIVVATYIVPSGAPLRVSEPEPFCAQQH